MCTICIIQKLCTICLCKQPSHWNYTRCMPAHTQLCIQSCLFTPESQTWVRLHSLSESKIQAAANLSLFSESLLVFKLTDWASVSEAASTYWSSVLPSPASAVLCGCFLSVVDDAADDDDDGVAGWEFLTMAAALSRKHTHNNASLIKSLINTKTRNLNTHTHTQNNRKTTTKNNNNPQTKLKQN